MTAAAAAAMHVQASHVRQAHRDLLHAALHWHAQRHALRLIRRRARRPRYVQVLVTPDSQLLRLLVLRGAN